MDRPGEVLEGEAHSADQVTNGAFDANLASALDTIHARVRSGDVTAAYQALFHILDSSRREAGSGWSPLVRDVIQQHPLLATLHLEPLTRRAWDKPRGYPGDAEMIDFVYGLHPARPLPDTIAAPLHHAVTSAVVGRAVRHRLDVLREAIDTTAARTPRGRVLALAAGHLREVDDRTPPGLDIVAVDQDETSLGHLSRRLAGRVTTVAASIRQLLLGRHPLRDFDLVYAAGLFDYLDDRVARRLARWMFDRLNPGGTLLIANFVPEAPGLGYLEAVMDWPLLYRSEAEVARLFGPTMSRSGALDVRTWRDPDHCIAFGAISKAV